VPGARAIRGAGQEETGKKQQGYDENDTGGSADEHPRLV
jgi:hypothetical protein